ncbi:MAG: SpoIIE family protein phosphatase [Deltaproteobacteria bacterium]|nr:SpoIIE family protein phosphatase [Deltaproteobacteria bacterium]
MRLRTVVFVSFALLVVVALGVSIGAVTLVTRRAARSQVGTELARSRDVTLELHALRGNNASAECRVVAEEPRLKAVVAAEDVAHETVIDVAQSLAGSLGSSIFVLTDGEGVLLADVAAPEAAGEALRQNAVVAGALADGERGGLWLDDRGPHQVQGCRLAFGQKTVGVLVIGRALDDHMAATVHRQTGAVVAIVLDDQVVAASGLPGVATGSEHAALAGRLGKVPVSGRSEVTVAGAHYFAAATPVPGYTGEHTLRYVVLRSIDEALAPGRRLTWVLAGVAAAALAGALLLALALARRLARPIDALVAHAEAIAGGDLATRKPHGTTEVRALAKAMNHMVSELEASRRSLADRERMSRELEIATRIQTSILPRTPALPGLELAARMRPADEVGGDYYDVLEVPGGDGGWIAIGDVSGHGLEAGLVMLMLQTAVSTLVREYPEEMPSRALVALNDVIYDNVQRRLQSDRHATLSLLRIRRDGRLTMAGAHLDVIIWRAESKRCEFVPTPGTWISVTDDIARATVDHEQRLHPGDVVVLHTDGLTEAMNRSGEQFGQERLAESLAGAAEASALAVCDRLLAATTRWSEGVAQADDMTVLVFRYLGPDDKGIVDQA